MELKKTVSGSRLYVEVSGKIDTNTGIEFGTEVNDALDGIADLIIDFKGVEYISSMGLRALLELYKTMIRKEGDYKLINVNEQVKEVLTLTGFVQFMKIEPLETV